MKDNFRMEILLKLIKASELINEVDVMLRAEEGSKEDEKEDEEE